jgi:hypothetical protein
VTSTEPYSDDEFTDLELSELDEDGSTESGGADGQLTDARARADELAQYSANLAQLDNAPLPEHVAYYQNAHAELQRALGEIDNA